MYQQIDQTLIKQLTNICCDPECLLAASWDGLWSDFGSKMGAKMEPSWHRIAKMTDIKIWSNKIEKMLCCTRAYAGVRRSRRVGPLNTIKQIFRRLENRHGNSNTPLRARHGGGCDLHPPGHSHKDFCPFASGDKLETWIVCSCGLVSGTLEHFSDRGLVPYSPCCMCSAADFDYHGSLPCLMILLLSSSTPIGTLCPECQIQS